MKPRILAIIPCLNEQDTIEGVITSLRHNCPQIDIFIIDDGSSDNTYQRASRLAATSRHATNLGIGAAIQTGILYALRNHYDLCIQVDGDGQHPADQLCLLIDHHLKTGANVVSGSRFSSIDSYRPAAIRRLGIHLIRLAIRLFAGRNFSDPTSGFRLLDREAMKIFSRHYVTECPEPVSIAIGLKRGLSFAEIPVVMSARESGSSSISGLRAASYMVRAVALIALAGLSSSKKKESETLE